MTVAVIQARLGSSRLPGKALTDVCGRPLLSYTVDRLRRARSVGTVVLATGEGAENDPLRAFAAASGLACFSGSEADVLDRFYRAALPYGPSDVLRITGDTPLLDPETVDRLVALFRENPPADIAGTGASMPEGVDAEVLSFAALEAAWKEARLPSEREHVTAFLWKRPERFAQKRLENPEDLSHIRVTCDEPADLEVIRRVVADFQGAGPATLAELAAYFKAHPEVRRINGHIVRNEGYLRSLAADPKEPG